MGFCDLEREEEIQNQLLAVCTQWLALLVAWEERAVSCGLSLGTPVGQTIRPAKGCWEGLSSVFSHISPSWQRHESCFVLRVTRTPVEWWKQAVLKGDVWPV